jgi:hypothetical protein
VNAAKEQDEAVRRVEQVKNQLIAELEAEKRKVACKTKLFSWLVFDLFFFVRQYVRRF